MTDGRARRQKLIADMIRSDGVGSQEEVTARLAGLGIAVTQATVSRDLETPPGSAHLVGLAIDQANLPEIAGTICGDDTLFLALRDGTVAGAIAHRFRTLSLSQE